MAQNQQIEELLAWISTRPENEKTIILNGINAIIDLVEDILKPRGVDDTTTSPTPEQYISCAPSIISDVELSSAVLTISGLIIDLPADSDVSAFWLQSTLCDEEGEDDTEVEAHRALALERLEGRVPIDRPTPERVQKRIKEQGLVWCGPSTECFDHPPEAFRLQQPLRRTRGLGDLRRATEEDEESSNEDSSNNEEAAEELDGRFEGHWTRSLPPPLAVLPAHLVQRPLLEDTEESIVVGYAPEPSPHIGITKPKPTCQSKKRRWFHSTAVPSGSG